MHMFLVRHAPRHCTIGIHLFSHAQESSIKTETGTEWKTTIEEVKDEESTPSGHFQEQPHQEQKQPEPFSSLWILS